MIEEIKQLECVEISHDPSEQGNYESGFDSCKKEVIEILRREDNGWRIYDWNTKFTRPTETGKYEVYRLKCDKQHYETWNGSGWAYNNSDITHYREIIKPTI